MSRMGSDDEQALRARLAEFESECARLNEQVKTLVRNEARLYAIQSKFVHRHDTFARFALTCQSFLVDNTPTSIAEASVEFLLYNLNFQRALVLERGPGEVYFRPLRWDGFYGDDIERAVGTLALTMPQAIRHDEGLASAPLLWHGVQAGREELAPLAEVLELCECVVISLLGGPMALSPQRYLVIAGNAPDALDYCERVRGESDALNQFRALSTAMASALETYHTHRALERQRAQLEGAVADRTEALLTALDAAERARLDAERANAAKSRFLANTSHELRTPLHGVIGYSELVLEQLDEIADPGLGRITEDVDAIRRSGAHLLSLINELLDLSKIEAGHMEAHIESVAVAPFCRELVDTMLPLSRERALDLGLTLDITRAEIVTDAIKLRQILLNLLGNAVKFTERGRVVLRVTDDAAGWCFAVLDTGPGIAPEFRERIFGEFEQGQPTRSSEGTGLGLSVCRKLSALLGGRIEVDSLPGRGSTFRLRLPHRDAVGAS